MRSLRAVAPLASFLVMLAACGGDEAGATTETKGNLPYTKDETIVIDGSGRRTPVATPDGDKCLDLGGECVKPQDTCGDGGRAEVIVDAKGKVVAIICYPVEGTVVTPVPESGAETVGADNNQVVVIDGADDGVDVTGDVTITGNNVVVYGAGPETSIIGGDVQVEKNNGTVHGVRVKGDVRIDGNNTAFVDCVIDGNLTITSNNNVLTNCTIFGKITVTGNNNSLLYNRGCQGIEGESKGLRCEGNVTCKDANADGVLATEELGAPLACGEKKLRIVLPSPEGFVGRGYAHRMPTARLHFHRPRFVAAFSLSALALLGCGGGELDIGGPASVSGAAGSAGSGASGGTSAGSGGGGRAGSAGGIAVGGSAGSAGSAGGGFCGDGVRGGKEACDGTDRGTATCASVTGIPSSTGTLGCFANCTLDGQLCTTGAAGGAAGAGGAAAGCGDGKRAGTEACDGNDLGTATCASLTGDAASIGKLACFANCTVNASDCRAGTAGAAGAAGAGGGASSACGDAVRSGKEQCDGADLGGATCVSFLGDPGAKGTIACHPNCTLDAGLCVLGAGGGNGGPAGCGDNVKAGTEACDGTSFGTATCASALGVPDSAGSLVCFPNCTLDLRGCATPPSGGGGAGGAPSNTCGDGQKAGTEQCDGAAFGIATCATVLGDPSATGNLVCFPNCTIDAKGCAFGPGGGGGAAGAAGGGAGGATGGAAGSATACVPKTCQGKVYDCGDCLDNDGDGRIDLDDTECLNPCDNAEKGFALEIPGGDGGKCKVDCYFDQDSGSGNDQCEWDQSCDPVSKAPDYYPRSDDKCGYDQGSVAANTQHQAQCTTLAASNGAACQSFCGPLVPNGCDCFGCCELPATNGKFIWLGSTQNGVPSCDLENVDDPTKCHPCTPVTACLNTCETCELCLGKTELPSVCLPPVPTCGDGVRGGREQCDGNDLAGQTCQSFTGVPAATGTLACAANCTVDGSNCQIPTGGGAPFCGNGIGEGFEQCDGNDVRGATCPSVTGVSSAVGEVACNPNCTLDGRGCTIPFGFCGDGVRRGFEQCDGADLAGATCATVTGDPTSTGEVACLPSCVLDPSKCTNTGGGGAGGSGAGGAGGAGGAPGIFCGDGVRNGTEVCDKEDLGGATCASVSGNPTSTGPLTCFPNCTLDASKCGPPGTAGSGGAGGSTSAMCGNGVREGTEGCDLTDFGGATCQTVTGSPDATGVLVCFANCTIDSSGCKVPTEECGQQVCPVGKQRCGLPCQDPCPGASFCLTGCCTSIN